MDRHRQGERGAVSDREPRRRRRKPDPSRVDQPGAEAAKCGQLQALQHQEAGVTLAPPATMTAPTTTPPHGGLGARLKCQSSMPRHTSGLADLTGSHLVLPVIGLFFVSNSPSSWLDVPSLRPDDQRYVGEQPEADSHVVFLQGSSVHYVLG